MRLFKPKFWGKKKSIFSFLLLPFSYLLQLLLFFRKIIGKKEKFSIPVICIGNIYLGGTGKTPLVIKLYDILSKLDFNAATIKKFYNTHIDEQRMLNQNTKLYCQKNRRAALHEAIKDNKEIVIFDDGLQDRSINNFNFFNSIKMIGNGLLIPAGPMREKIESISKYDVAFINGNQIDNSIMKLLIKKHNKNIKIFESHYVPTDIDQFDKNEKYIIFSGIGTPESFKETLVKNRLNIVREIIFPDHYNYTQTDIDKIKSQAKTLNAKIITTEKDYTKINPNDNHEIKFLKIELKIINEAGLVNYLKKNL